MSEFEKILNKEIDRIVKDVMVDEDGEFKGSYKLTRNLGINNLVTLGKGNYEPISK
jgi:hypothetical protein